MDLQLGVSEAYELDVPATFYSSGSAVATLTADTVFGAYRGLETLSQLIRFDFGSSSYVVDGAPIKISDAPRFPHREILLDSARHYEPVRVIEAILDSLAYAKLNTLHWHISDSQSFPFVAPSHPELAEAAAFSPGERYTAGDVAAVVAYARSLGIRVVVEVDTPGHAASFCASNPDVCPAPDCPEPLLISNKASFELIGDIFADFAAVTTDEIFHLGGDEVRYDCWNKSDAMKAWMAAEKLATFDDAYAYAVQRVAAGVKAAHGRAAIVWGEAWDTFGPSMPKDTIFDFWLGGGVSARGVANATSHGYRVLWNVGRGSNVGSWRVARRVRKLRRLFFEVGIWIHSSRHGIPCTPATPARASRRSSARSSWEAVERCEFPPRRRSSRRRFRSARP